MGAFDQSIGFLLLAVLINTYLFGLVSYQFITYYTLGFKDPPWIRIMVAVLVVTDTVHSLGLMYMIWVYWSVTNFTNPEALEYALWPHTITPIVVSIIAINTHLFLGYRVYRLTKSKLLYGFICISAVTGFVLGCIIGIRASIIRVFAKFGVLSNLVTYSTSIQLALDLLICGMLIKCLHTSRTDFGRTNTIIYRLMHTSIQTGVFCTVFALATLITFRASPQTNLFAIFSFPMGRVYTNTLMDTLNVRHALRDVLNESRAINISVALGSQLQPDRDTPNNGAKVLAAEDSTRGESSIQSSLVFKRPVEVTSDPSTADFISSKENSERDRASGLPT